MVCAKRNTLICLCECADRSVYLRFPHVVSMRLLGTFRGWSGGAMVLGKLPVPGRPTSLDKSRTRACCSCGGCGWGLFGHFYSLLSFLSSFSLFGRRPDID